MGRRGGPGRSLHPHEEIRADEEHAPRAGRPGGGRDERSRALDRPRKLDAFIGYSGLRSEVNAAPLQLVVFRPDSRILAFTPFRDLLQQYWLNRFGNDHATVPGSLANAFFFGLRYHLRGG